ncbi:MAG: ABC transporter ATP-binding protein [Leucobacter sp.]
MNQPSDPNPEQQTTPTRRDRLKPAELLGFSGVLAIFAGLVVLMASRQIVLTLVFTLIAFILSLVVVALLGLGGKPSEEDNEARKDLNKPDADWH